MKLLRVILFLLFLLGFATWICSYIGLATIKSADALVRADLAQKSVTPASIDDASRRIHALEEGWSPIWVLGFWTTALSLLALGLTFRSAAKPESAQPPPIPGTR